MRELGRQWSTTASTVSRAQRALADAGLIELADRRRARVAPDAALAARRFLHGDVVLRLAGSDDPALDLVVRGLGRTWCRCRRRQRRRPARGRAGSRRRRRDPPAAPQRPLQRALRPRPAAWPASAPGPPVAARAGAARPAGAPGRPRSATRRAEGGPAGPGTGTRVLLDRLLLDAGHDPDALRGPEFGSHLEVALAVATGIVDAGLGVRSAAAASTSLRAAHLGGLRPRAARRRPRPGRPAHHRAAHPALRAAVAALGGYDTARAGEVVDLDRTTRTHDQPQRLATAVTTAVSTRGHRSPSPSPARSSGSGRPSASQPRAA